MTMTQSTCLVFAGLVNIVGFDSSLPNGVVTFSVSKLDLAQIDKLLLDFVVSHAASVQPTAPGPIIAILVILVRPGVGRLG